MIWDVMSFHSPQDFLELWNVKGEKKVGSYHVIQARISHPPFIKHQQREFLFLRSDLDFDLVFIRSKQGLGRKRLTFDEFFLSHRLNHNSQNTEWAEKHTVFRSAQRRHHFASHRTGFQNEKPSIQDANRVTFKEFA